jgi:hypothetical protein
MVEGCVKQISPLFPVHVLLEQRERAEDYFGTKLACSVNKMSNLIKKKPKLHNVIVSFYLHTLHVMWPKFSSELVRLFTNILNKQSLMIVAARSKT